MMAIKKSPSKAAKLPQITEQPSMEEMNSVEASERFDTTEEEIVEVVDDGDNVSEGSGLALETEEIQVNTKKGLADIFKGFQSKRSRDASRIGTTSHEAETNDYLNDRAASPEDCAFEVQQRRKRGKKSKKK